MAEADILHGFQNPQSGNDDTNGLNFQIKQFMAKVWTSALVRVEAVTNDGGLSAVGSVDVTPLVHQINGIGAATPHAVIHGMPYFRIQGGANAMIMDPQVGDIGLAVICSRDISAVKVSKAPNVPGSYRRFDPADGLYIGGFLNAVPTQYVRFSADGIEIISPTRVKITAPHVDLISDDVNLGGTGGKKVVLDGDPVVGGGGGTVQASSTKVKAV